MEVKNLFAGLDNSQTNALPGLTPEAPSEEIVEVLHASDAVRIERIISLGHASPPNFWYDQPNEEWVLLIRGAARLRFEDEPVARSLTPGDYCHIAAHRRHRVDWTDPRTPTIWLAIHHGH